MSLRPELETERVIILFVVVSAWIFQARVSLCSSSCSVTCSVDQTGIELRDLCASASGALELKACATPTQQKGSLLRGDLPSQAKV